MSGHGPCWPPPDTSLACCRGIDLDASDVADEVARWAPVAARILWALSGRRWGLCEVTVRSCGRGCDGEATYYGRDNYGGVPFNPPWRDGAWVNYLCGRVAGTATGRRRTTTATTTAGPRSTRICETGHGSTPSATVRARARVARCARNSCPGRWRRS